MVSRFEKNRLISTFFVFLLVSSILPIANAEEINLVYDANGNLIQDADFYYEYNSLNQLVQIREKNSQGRILAKYTYDYNGNRVLKELFDAQGKSKSIYYPDENLVREIDERTKAVNDVVYYYDSDLVAKKENNKLSFYHADQIGSTSVVTDEQGKVLENNHYLPFGEMLSGENDRYLYTGQELDPESQLYYYGARYYSPYLAKFTQPDTIIQDPYNPQNLNRYSYVLNNPYKYNDPNGNFFDIALDVGFVAWDVYDLVKNPISTTNWVSLGLDVVSGGIPFVAGLGIAYKAGKSIKAADKIIKVEKTIEKGTDAVRVADKAVDAVKAADKAKDVAKEFKIKDLYTSHPVDNPEGLFEKSKFRTHTDIKDSLEIVRVNNIDIVAHGHGRTARNIANGKDTVLGRYIYNSDMYKGPTSKNVQKLEQRWVNRANQYGKFRIKEIKEMYRGFIGK